MKIMRKEIRITLIGGLLAAASLAHAADYSSWNITASGLSLYDGGFLNDRGQILAIDQTNALWYESPRLLIADQGGARINVADYENLRATLDDPQTLRATGLTNNGEVGYKVFFRGDGFNVNYVTGPMGGSNRASIDFTNDWGTPTQATKNGLLGVDGTGEWSLPTNGTFNRIEASTNTGRLWSTMYGGMDSKNLWMDSKGRVVMPTNAYDEFGSASVYVNLTPGGPIQTLALPVAPDQSMSLKDVSSSGLLAGVLESQSAQGDVINTAFIFDLDKQSFQRLMGGAVNQHIGETKVNAAGDLLYQTYALTPDGTRSYDAWQFLGHGQTQSRSLDAMSGLDFQILEVYGFNDGGQILVETDQNLDGVYELHLLTPVPEPGTFALMALGLGLVGATARRRRRAH